MEILPLYYYNHEALRSKSTSIPKITTETADLAQKMINTMRHHQGIGLAAPQIGINISLVVIEIPATDPRNTSANTSPGEINLLSRMPLVLVNMKLSDYSPSTNTASEGCLSIPGVNADVERAEYVQLEAQSIHGHRISYRCGGLLARCLQHELDHLNGILFIDLIKQKELKRLTGKLRKLEKQTKSQPN